MQLPTQGGLSQSLDLSQSVAQPVIVFYICDCVFQEHSTQSLERSTTHRTEKMRYFLRGNKVDKMMAIMQVDLIVLVIITVCISYIFKMYIVFLCTVAEDRGKS